MQIKDYFPAFQKLTPDQQHQVEEYAALRTIPKGTVVHDGTMGCTGFLLVKSGQLRAYILSDEGREVTLYRLFPMDACLFSASCLFSSIQFDVTVETEKDSEIWILPAVIYQKLMKESLPIANYTNELMADHMNDVMWLMEQVMWKSFDKRLAGFLLEESAIEEALCLKITHEKIANHLGTAREVVTRMLRYFQNEGMVKLTRGAIELTDPKQLQELQDA